MLLGAGHNEDVHAVVGAENRALKRPTAPYERKSDRENAARFPPLASQHNPVFRQRDGPDAGPESSQDRSAQRARSYDGRGSPAKPSAARRSWPRWSSTGYSIT